MDVIVDATRQRAGTLPGRGEKIEDSSYPMRLSCVIGTELDAQVSMGVERHRVAESYSDERALITTRATGFNQRWAVLSRSLLPPLGSESPMLLRCT